MQIAKNLRWKSPENGNISKVGRRLSAFSLFSCAFPEPGDIPYEREKARVLRAFRDEGVRYLKLNKWLAGAGGFEPPYGGIKIHCLTTWRRPKAEAEGGEPCRETRSGHAGL